MQRLLIFMNYDSKWKSKKEVRALGEHEPVELRSAVLWEFCNLGGAWERCPRAVPFVFLRLNFRARPFVLTRLLFLGHGNQKGCGQDERGHAGLCSVSFLIR